MNIIRVFLRSSGLYGYLNVIHNVDSDLHVSSGNRRWKRKPSRREVHRSPPAKLRREPKTSMECGEIMRAIEVVERDSAAIAESFNSLFSSLRLALSEVTTTSVENMQCFSDVVGRVQESALDAATKGNRYINSCLRLNEEMKGVDSLAMRLKVLKKNVDTLDVAVNQLVHFS
ncbi:uncharacterized protein LOC120275603 [Dioscorea cayenensis subsp. rotundata]|uniref:Uncharacterized protein LOC120275603 n=1 Tax=Dioscorea cayennensis subsp. rotundata TaxID=55577 RepID=A0AB40CE07_DIOCR|nr:uncharacterized protein LOC120275603 [Dioscorea cayenensis subsp. rotundata]